MLLHDIGLPTRAQHVVLMMTVQLTGSICTVVCLLHLHRRLHLCHSDHNVHVRRARLRLRLPLGLPAVRVISLRVHLPCRLVVNKAPALVELAPSCMHQPSHPVCMLHLQVLWRTRIAGPTAERHSGKGRLRETPAALGDRGWLR